MLKRNATKPNIFRKFLNVTTTERLEGHIDTPQHGHTLTPTHPN